MNARTISLLLVAVNLGLAMMLAYMVYFMKATGRPLAAPTRTQYVTNTVTQIAVRKINATNVLLSALANRPLSWQALESTNYVAYIENLRNFGCPDDTIRDIIITDVAKLYARRRAAIRAQAQGGQYWLPTESTETPQVRAQLRELEREEQQLIKSLLGADLRRELARYAGEEDFLEANIAFLPPDKQERVAALQEKYSDLEQDVYSRARGLFLDEDQEELKKLQRAREAELAQVLSPEELEEYQLRNSDTANNLRATLTGFEPNEEEFRKIFRLQKTFDDQFNQAFDATDENAVSLKARAQQDAQEALNAELQKVLGPERFAEYQRAQDGDYRSLLQLGERFDLPRGVANSVYEMKTTAERQKQRVELNPSLTEEQRTQMLAAIARETERSVAGLMGEDAYKAYARSGGQWINGLSTPQFSLSELNPPPPQPPLPPLPPELRNFLLNPPVLGNPPPVQVNPSPVGR
jgi:hypothetical protein